MVHPNVPAILLTPICPHSLSFRPIILPDYAELEFRIPENARCTAWACFDGRSRQELARGDAIRVRMSDAPMPTINKADLTIDWFDSLERCFRWSDRKQQAPLREAENLYPVQPRMPMFNGLHQEEEDDEDEEDQVRPTTQLLPPRAPHTMNGSKSS